MCNQVVIKLSVIRLRTPFFWRNYLKCSWFAYKDTANKWIKTRSQLTYFTNSTPMSTQWLNFSNVGHKVLEVLEGGAKGHNIVLAGDTLADLFNLKLISWATGQTMHTWRQERCQGRLIYLQVSRKASNIPSGDWWRWDESCGRPTACVSARQCFKPRMALLINFGITDYPEKAWSFHFWFKRLSRRSFVNILTGKEILSEIVHKGWNFHRKGSQKCKKCDNLRNLQRNYQSWIRKLLSTFLRQLC